MSPLAKEIHVFDATKDGVPSPVKAFFRSYSKFKVHLHRVKAAKNLPDNLARKNRAILDSILLYKAKSGSLAYVHINPNIFFKGHALQILSDNAQLYSCVSPVIENIKGLEVLDGVADRWGFNIYDKGAECLSLVTGQVEETFAINHKCFAISDRYIRKIGKIWQSQQETNKYINSILVEYGNMMPRVDTNVFVHEELY